MVCALVVMVQCRSWSNVGVFERLREVLEVGKVEAPLKGAYPSNQIRSRRDSTLLGLPR